jgi:hypothetical protein
MMLRHYAIAMSRRRDVGSLHDFDGAALCHRDAVMFCRFDGVTL